MIMVYRAAIIWSKNQLEQKQTNKQKELWSEKNNTAVTNTDTDTTTTNNC